MILLDVTILEVIMGLGVTMKIDYELERKEGLSMKTLQINLLIILTAITPILTQKLRISKV